MRRMSALLAVVLFFGAPAAVSSAEAFDPAGWETNTDHPLLGDPEAKKGGTLRSYWTSMPPTLRTHGPNSNWYATSRVHSMVFESLIGIHPTTLEYIPGLASHWKISKDKRTFWFRIDPRARWADGSPVTAHDVVATAEWEMRKDINDPYANMHWEENFEKPVAESDSVVRVRAKKLHWRLFIYFGGMTVFPAKELKGLTGETFLGDYNWKLFMGSGPYELAPGGVKKEHSITLQRRKGYWAEKDRSNIGLNNFDKLAWLIILDEILAFEKFKKGELDFYLVNKSQRWVEECDFDKVKMGWVQKRKIYTKEPEGYSGLVFNMRKPPFNDRNVRKAFAHLFNRERLIEKLFFNEYGFIDSYWPGGPWGNPDNPKIRYDPRRAAQLLARAGWKERDKDGWLVKDGKPFELAMEYGEASLSRVYKVVKEDFEKAGIKLNLKLLDANTVRKKVSERNFTIYHQSWGAILFPNPESSWSAKLAGKHTNNVPGFEDKRVDELSEQYNKTFDRAEQMKLIHRIDKLIFQQHPYALGWSAGFQRILYWNKFGHPEKYFPKMGALGRGSDGLIKTTWWFDPAKEKALEDAMSESKKLPVGKMIQKPWEESGK